MQRYFFNLHECGHATPDEEGVLLADVSAARDRAIVEARAILAAEVATGKICLDCNIEVRDEAGDLVVDLPFAEALTVQGTSAHAH